MRINHNVKIENNIYNIYLNIIVEDDYEFGMLRNSNETVRIWDKIKGYLKRNNLDTKNAIVTIVINGVLIGTLTLSTLLAYSTENSVQNFNFSLKKSDNTIVPSVLEVQTLTAVDDTVIQNQTNSANKVVNSTQTSNNKTQTTVKPSSPTTNKNPVNNTTDSYISKENVANTNNTSSNIESSKKEESSVNEEEVNKVEENIYIKLNNNGVVASIELEEYIIGVVAAEMPASFNLEALKAQAVAARTYTMKKASAGKTLVNSTSDQVYNTVAQMKSKWGSEFTKYYNKIKNAVESTKGLVMKYNGKYIDALYFSMTNGKTEQPEYVWAYSYPYLKCVSSSWDQNVKEFEVTKNFEYQAVSSALGQTVTKDTEIEVVSYTVSGRVDKIKIGDNTYTGVQVRSKLGLRSTDFTIILNDSNISITTKGYGHGVGLSQYGANEMGKQGYTYDKILRHYYTGIEISKY